MENNIARNEWKTFYLVSSICVFTALAVMFAEMLITLLPDGAYEHLTVGNLLDLYNRNWFMGMRYMGFINIIATTLMIPVFFSLFGVHRKSNRVFAGFALILTLVSYAIFISDNVSFPLLNLSRKYLLSYTNNYRSLILSSAEALFAKGASHTSGTFPGFFLSEIGTILFCIIMIKGNIFRKRTGVIGLIAFAFLFIFEIISSFIISLYNEALIFAIIGGIFALTWYGLVGLELLKAAKSKKQ